MARNQHDSTYDDLLLLHDGVAALIAVGANVGIVSAAPCILDLGASRVDARAIVDVSALDVAGGDEAYFMHIQGSNSPTFAGVDQWDLGGMYIGEDLVTIVTGGIGADTVVPFHAEIAFCNQVNGNTYRYVRFNVITIGATVSFTGTVFLALES